MPSPPYDPTQLSNSESDPADGTFGSFIKALRLKAGKTQKEVAEYLQQRLKTNTPPQGLIAQYERGLVREPSKEVVSALAALFGEDYLRLVWCVLRTRYEPPEGWTDAVTRARLKVIDATWRQPRAIGRVTGEHGAIIAPGVPGFDAAQLDAKAELVAGFSFLTVDALTRWEAAVPWVSTFWVIAPDFLADQRSDIQDAVVTNLLKKPPIEYVYFIHPDFGTRFWNYLEMLRAHRKMTARARATLTTSVRAYRIEEKVLPWLSSDHLVALGDRPEQRIVFRYLRDESVLLAYQVDKSDSDRMLKTWRNWIRNDRLVRKR